MKTIFRSVRRHKPQPQSEVENETAGPFFSKQAASSRAVQPKSGAFFQPKLTIGQPDDQYEREADAVADKVVGQQASGKVREAQPSVQRLATPDEEKMPATNDGRMAEDKKIQEKPEVQRAENSEKEEEKPAVQKMEAPDKKEEEKPAVQKMEAPDKKEEEKPAVQKMEAPDKKEEEKPAVQKMDAPDKEEETPVQAKAASGGAQKASPQLSGRIESSRGRGNKLPAGTRAQMEASFGRDFGDVHVHTDTASNEMNRELGAQAFTHGSDVYFGSGKYQPESTAGQRLLAHELTHVVQQNGPRLKPEVQKQASPAPTTQQLPNIATPVPSDAVPTTGGEVHLVVNGVQVIIRPDVHSRRRGRGAETTFRQRGGNISQVRTAGGHITSFAGPSPVTVSILTTFQRRADPADPSAYGRGTTAADQASGDTSLGFHEGSHGTDYLAFLSQHPLPVFNGEVGMTQRAFTRAIRAFQREMRTYFQDMGRQSLMETDCTGTTIDDANHSHVCEN